MIKHISPIKWLHVTFFLKLKPDIYERAMLHNLTHNEMELSISGCIPKVISIVDNRGEKV